MALHGFGIIQRSEWDVAAELKCGKLVKLLQNYELPKADIVALLGTNLRARSARTIKFLELLKSKLTVQP